MYPAEGSATQGAPLSSIGPEAAFAWRVLTAGTLADKVRPPDATDVDAAASALPTVPSRPAALAFRPRPARDRLPPPAGLRSDRDRGRILHAMANHELLALELFALAILRFPELPAAHRRAFVSTMTDEQRHLAGYLDRLRGTGVEPGTEPLSTFFWDALAPVDEVGAFVAGLSLCLEQANLDFAGTWARAFAEAGDPTTADLLRRVRDDEVRHLRSGAATFRAVTGAPLTFEAFRAALRPPLSVARARGPELDREGRRRAGLSDDFVDAVATAGGSRGRVPRLLILAPGVEDELAGRSPRPLPALAPLAMWMGTAQDAVLAPPPPASVLRGLAEAGFGVPTFVPPGSPVPSHQGVVSWASPPADRSSARALFGKAFAARCLAELLPAATLGLRPSDVGIVCRTPSEVEAALGAGPHLVKADLSAAGRHRVVVSGSLAGAPGPIRAFVTRALARGPVVVEPVLSVVAELSHHVTVREDGESFDGLTRFVARRGVYRGTRIGPPDLGVPRLARFLHRDGSEPGAVASELGRAAAHVASRARAWGHTGPLSLDALIVEDPSGALRLKPVSEVNPRWTMSRLALAIGRRLAPGSVGWWWFVPRAAFARAGLDGDAFRAALAGVLPAELAGGRLRRGGLPTTDPAADPTTWLVVAPRSAEVDLALSELVSRWPLLGPALWDPAGG